MGELRVILRRGGIGLVGHSTSCCLHRQEGGKEIRELAKTWQRCGGLKKDSSYILREVEGNSQVLLGAVLSRHF